MTNTFEIGGDGEESDILVCARLSSPLMYPDNGIACCAECGEAIQYRPHAPKGPRKICLACAEPMISASAATGELHSMITPETVTDLKNYIKKRVN